MLQHTDRDTINALSRRTDGEVIRVTMAFAVGGALMDVAAHTSGVFMGGAGVSMLWGLWIPLCFLTIPPIHYLCRRVKSLEERLEALSAPAAGQSESDR